MGHLTTQQKQRYSSLFNPLYQRKGLAVVHPAVGNEYKLGDATIQILAPLSDNYSDVNNYSIAMRIQDGDTSFLITGDAEAESEKEIIASKLTLDSDVYIMGHHGSGTSTSWDLLQAATPEYAVLSCGARQLLWTSTYRIYGKTGCYGYSLIPY